ATGEQRWEKRRFSRDADVLGVAGRILTWDPSEWSISALTPATGKRAWSRNLGAAPRSVTSCVNHRVGVATHRGHIDGGREQTLYASAFDPYDGKLLWSIPVQGIRIGAAGNSIFVQRVGPQIDEMTRIDCATSAASPMTWIEGLELPAASTTQFA